MGGAVALPYPAAVEIYVAVLQGWAAGGSNGDSMSRDICQSVLVARIPCRMWAGKGAARGRIRQYDGADKTGRTKSVALGSCPSPMMENARSQAELAVAVVRELCKLTVLRPGGKLSDRTATAGGLWATGMTRLWARLERIHRDGLRCWPG